MNRRCLLALALVLVVGASLAAIPSAGATGGTFQPGDVFGVYSNDGGISWYHPDGTYVQELIKSEAGAASDVLTFDAFGRLYTDVPSQEGKIVRFRTDGTEEGVFAQKPPTLGQGNSITAMVVDGDGNLFVAMEGAQADIYEYDQAGQLVHDFDVPLPGCEAQGSLCQSATEPGFHNGAPVGDGAFMMSVAGCTLTYADIGGSSTENVDGNDIPELARYDICTDQPLASILVPDAAPAFFGGPTSYVDLHDGTFVLVGPAAADPAARVGVHFDSAGQVIASYPVPDGVLQSAFTDFGAATPDGTHVWLPCAPCPNAVANGYVELAVLDGATAGVFPTHDGAQADFVGVVQSVAAPPNKPPTAAFAAVPGAKSVSLNASASSDPDGTVVSYHWDFGDGATLTTTTPTVVHRYKAPGLRTVTLTVTDNQGATSDPVQHVVHVGDKPPVAVFTLPKTAAHGVQVPLDGSASFDHDGSVAGWSWSILAGNTQVASLAGAQQTYMFPSAGKYSVILTVVDNDGAVSKRLKKKIKIT
jgi:PKD repeat protein